MRPFPAPTKLAGAIGGAAVAGLAVILLGGGGLVVLFLPLGAFVGFLLCVALSIRSAGSDAVALFAGASFAAHASLAGAIAKFTTWQETVLFGLGYGLIGSVTGAFVGCRSSLQRVKMLTWVAPVVLAVSLIVGSVVGMLSMSERSNTPGDCAILGALFGLLCGSVAGGLISIPLAHRLSAEGIQIDVTLASSVAGPRVLYGTTEKFVGMLLARVPKMQDETVLVAGRTQRETEFIFFVLPLWFNIVTTYLVITDHRLVVGASTLWRGPTTVASMDFAEIHAVDMKIGKKRIVYVTAGEVLSKIHVRLKNGKMVTLNTKNHEFASAVADALSNFLAVNSTG